MDMDMGMDLRMDMDMRMGIDVGMDMVRAAAADSWYGWFCRYSS